MGMEGDLRGKSGNETGARGFMASFLARRNGGRRRDFWEEGEGILRER